MYSDSERKIFKFHDGERERFVDPIATLRTFMSQPDFDFEADRKNADSGDVTALFRVVDATRATFNLKPFDEDTGSGVLDQEAITIATDFVEYMVDLQKKTESSQTLPDTSDSVDESITKPSLDCGLTDNVS